MKKYLLPILLLLAGACSQTATFEKYEELPEETWNRSNIIELTANIPDSGLYSIKLCLRHTTDYEMANLWCFISTRSSGVNQLKDTVNLKVAEPDGRWLGEGGAIKTLEQPINQTPFVLPKGDVTFRIEQGMRLEEMKGVKNIGIRIVKAGSK